MQTVPLISDAVIFRFLHSHKTGLHLNHAEKSLNHILRVLISREKHLKDISSSPDFSSSPQTPSRNSSLPVDHVFGSLLQWRDRNGFAPFSLSMLVATYILNVTRLSLYQRNCIFTTRLSIPFCYSYPRFSVHFSRVTMPDRYRYGFLSDILLRWN